MVYIDAFNHAKITQNKNRNVKMTHNDSTIILSDFTGNDIVLRQKDNIIYSLNKMPDMLNYNQDLLRLY
jgi:hypothetical protein